MNLHTKAIAIIGLGHVGLPLAVAFGKQRPVVGFDINRRRIAELQSGIDHTLQVAPGELALAPHLAYSSEPHEIAHCQIFIVTVPTRVDKANRPDLSPLVNASETVGRALKPGDIVVYESTVYPGATEEVCVPALERISGLRFNQDFFCGYSPARSTPGDPQHGLPSPKKVTSGSTPAVASAVDALYAQVCPTGTHPASSIKVAEAAHVMENTQRDLNIALVNELSLIFQRLGIDTLDVLKAAGTQWDFLPFRPGLVESLRVGAAPYYLTHKAQEVGYHPEVIPAGRRVNDDMARHVADQTVKLMLGRGIPVLGSRVLVLGLTVQANAPDLRNTQVLDIVHHLQAYHTQVDVYDPWIDLQEARETHGLRCLAREPEPGQYDAIVVAVAHHEFLQLGAEGIKAWGTADAVLYDVKAILPAGTADARL